MNNKIKDGDYIFTYKSKTAEGCMKRMVIMFLSRENDKQPSVVSISKYVIVKKETVDKANGSFNEENGWICLRKFSKCYFFKQSILMQLNDLFAINGMFASVSHQEKKQDVLSGIKFEMYLNIGFDNNGNIYRRISCSSINTPANCNKCCFSKDFCTGTYDAFEGEENPICEDSANSYYWIKAETSEDFNFVIQECIRLEMFEKINSIAAKLNSVKDE